MRTTRSPRRASIILGVGVALVLGVVVAAAAGAPTKADPGTNNEPDGSIVEAELLDDGGSGDPFIAGPYRIKNVIGDGDYGSGGTASGDFDVYQIAWAVPGQTIVVDTDAEEALGSTLDTMVWLYDATGTQLDFNDDDNITPPVGHDSYLEYSVTTAGSYFVAVGSCCAPLTDPFDPASGSGVFTEGDYIVSFSLVQTGQGDNAKIEINNTNPVVDKRTLLRLTNAGVPAFRIVNKDNGQAWELSHNVNQHFQINEVGAASKFIVKASGGLTARNAAGEVILNLLPNGNLEIGGVLVESSDVAGKVNIEAIDSAALLEILSGLDLYTWSYADAPNAQHLGPMAQDFYEAFGLGSTPTGISSLDTSGVSLAAIQALIDRNAELEARIAHLEALVLEALD